jgi:hypothetical protein
MFAGPQIKPIGGNIMAHASTTRSVKQTLFLTTLSTKRKMVPCLNVYSYCMLLTGLLCVREEETSASVK